MRASSTNTCSGGQDRTPVQDGFHYIAGVRLFSRQLTGPSLIVSYNLASSQIVTYQAASESDHTSVAQHPFRYDVYYCRPDDNLIFVTDVRTNEVSVFPTTVQLNQPHRLEFGSDSTLYVLHGDPSAGFELLALKPDGTPAGMAGQGTMGAMAYHEKTRRVYWWSGPSNQLQAFTPMLDPIGAPITLPTGPAFISPGYLAADPTGEILYYNHQGSSMIFRFDLATLSPLPPISDLELADPADLVLNNRGHLYVAQGMPAPVLEFDREGNRVTTSAAANFIANNTLAITRAIRTPILQDEELYNLDNDAVDCIDDNECDNDDVCTWDRCIDGECTNTPNLYGNVDHDGDVDLFDLFYILNGFSGDFSVCSFKDVDLEPCEGDGDVDLFDLFAVLNAFSGGDPCCGG